MTGTSGAVAAAGDDAVQVAACFADAKGDGVLSRGYSALISRVAIGLSAGTISGFHPLAW